MAKFRVDNVQFIDVFIDEEIEAENEIEAQEQVMQEIIDNIGNYIDIDLYEVYDEEEEDEE